MHFQSILIVMTGGGEMDYKIRKIEITDEANELGSLFMERLIERMVLNELGLSASYQAFLLSKRYTKKGSTDVCKEE